MTLKYLDGIKVADDFNLPHEISPEALVEDAKLYDKAKSLLLEKKVFLIAHYYCSHIIQKLCDEVGGFIGDSLEMARVGRDSEFKTLMVAGVRFMGQTAKILSPEKTVLMPDLRAECSLDLCCTADNLKRAKEAHPEAVVVAYANTSAEVKAQSDWIVTSSLAVSLGKYLASQGKEILWVPDKNLGGYIENNSKADLYSWPGMCIVHDSFDAQKLQNLKAEHPNAQVLVHPEAPKAVVDLADFVGSTSQILAFAKKSNNQEFIITTEHNIFYKLQQACPNKTFIKAPVLCTKRYDRTTPACPWMELNSLEKMIEALENHEGHEIFVDENLRVGALKPLDRMLSFSQDLKDGKIVIA